MVDVKEMKKIAIRLGENVKNFTPRFVFQTLKRKLKKEPRIKLVRGFRGSGKTTLLLQIFNEYRNEAFYFSADNPLVAKENLYYVMKDIISSGSKILLIDEIHKYPEWRKDVKAIYDEYPEVTIVCSGSAPLAFVPERREEVIEVEPMSFDEFLKLKYGITIKAANEWRSEEKSMELVAKHSPKIEAYFREYVEIGGFPISITYDEASAKKAIFYSIRKSVYEDSVSLLKMSQEKVFAMNKILVFLSSSEPGELSINSISSLVEMSKSCIYEILDALEKMRIVRILQPYGKGGKLVRGSPKMLFYHPNLRVSICSEIGVEASVGSLREEIAVFLFSLMGAKVFTVKERKKSPDYYISKPIDAFVEIGGKGKSKKQLKGFRKSFILKPDQLIALSLCSRKTD